MSSHEQIEYSKTPGSTAITENSSMAGLSWRSALLAFCVTLLLCSLEVHAGLCLDCSYNYAGDGTTDYECVSTPASYVLSRTISCNFDNHSCTVRTVYSNSGNNQIQSINRSCQASSGKDFHCTTTTPTSCELECRTDLCNNGHGNISGKNSAFRLTTIKASYRSTGSTGTSTNYPLIIGITAAVIVLKIIIICCCKMCKDDDD